MRLRHTALIALVLVMAAAILPAIAQTSNVYLDILNSKLTTKTHTVTASSPLIDLTQTWNNGGVTFILDSVNVTDTASAAGSVLFRRRVGGSDKISVNKSGDLTLAGTIAATGFTPSGLTASKPVFTDSNKLLVSTGTLGADQGGTGLATYAVGDIPYASAATTISKLAAVATGQVLVSAGVTTAPAYSATPTVNTITLATPKITAGSGTGVTVNDAGSVRTQVYKVTVLNTNLTSAATTHDLTIATLPAKTIVHSFIADVTVQFACTAVCTSSTLSMVAGISAGATEFLASADIDAAATMFGNADAELGSALTIAGQFNSGYVSAAGTAVVVRFTSGTGNWGDGASATNTSGGSVTFYIVATVLP